MSLRCVNRCALIVKPRQPYADWANGFDDDGPRFDLRYHRNNPTVFLITEPDDLENLDVALKRHWRRIFEEQLSAWMRQPSDWPPRRTLTVFREWFDVTLSDLVLDLSRKYLEAE